MTRRCRVLIVSDEEAVGVVNCFESENIARNWIANHGALLYPNALFKVEMFEEKGGMKAGEARKTLSGWRYGTQSGVDIITVCVAPPIPIREWDWCAYHDGNEEKPHWYGWGKTEQEALADMRRLDMERYESETLTDEDRDNDDL